MWFSKDIKKPCQEPHCGSDMQISGLPGHVIPQVSLSRHLVATEVGSAGVKRCSGKVWEDGRVKGANLQLRPPSVCYRSSTLLVSHY